MLEKPYNTLSDLGIQDAQHQRLKPLDQQRSRDLLVPLNLLSSPARGWADSLFSSYHDNNPISGNDQPFLTTGEFIWAVGQ